MTPADLKAIRRRVAPDLSQAAFARALGYRDARTYRRYESGKQDIPPRLVERMMQVSRAGRLPET